MVEIFNGKSYWGFKIAQNILETFNDSKIGLLFPEDVNTANIGKNKTYIDKLCNMLGLSVATETPLFPIGNMFWARTDAIKELFYLDKEIILQEEPLPYDGSFMHAIERITPYLIEKKGYSYKSIYRKNIKWK